MLVRFWGVRGSIPAPDRDAWRYGGNTPCLELRDPDGQLFILDAGTGIRDLGRQWLSEFKTPGLHANLLFTHYHWDHIQGLPFFAPLFDERSEVRIWGPKQGKVDLERILREQMNPVVFPVPLEQLDAKLTVTHVEPGSFEVGGFVVRAMTLRHPGTTFAYRLVPRSGGPTVVYVTDNELGPGGSYHEGPRWRRELTAFADGADVLIHDAMFTTEELDRHRGWGHSSHAEAVKLAAEAAVKKLVLFHHKPERHDAGMDALVAEARTLAAEMARDLVVEAAVEGVTLFL